MAVLKYYDGTDWEPVASALVGPTGATGVTGPTGATGAAASSKVVQIVAATTSTNTASSSTSYADTTLTATITPTSASNKVLVFVNQAGMTKGLGNSQNAGDIKLVRGATDIMDFALNQNYTGTAIEMITNGASGVILDTPATTSATTYKTQFRSDVSGQNFRVQDGNAVSSICLMEVTP
jgi:hypothetical protein